MVKEYLSGSHVLFTCLQPSMDMNINMACVLPQATDPDISTVDWSFDMDRLNFYRLPRKGQVMFVILLHLNQSHQKSKYMSYLVGVFVTFIRGWPLGRLLSWSYPKKVRKITKRIPKPSESELWKTSSLCKEYPPYPNIYTSIMPWITYYIKTNNFIPQRKYKQYLYPM